MSEDDIEAALESRREALGTLGHTVRFELDDAVIVVDGTRQPAEVRRADEEAECTLALSRETLQEILQGSLDATMAYMTGRLKVRGDTGVAMKLAGLLK